MSNPSGANQFGGSEAPYGEVKRLTELTRSAPMSGAPVAAHAVASPRRAQRRSQRRARQGPAPTPEQVAESAVMPAQPDYSGQIASVWQEIATTPGADPLIGEYAAEAQRRAGK